MIRRLIPSKIKQEIRSLACKLLHIPYNKFGLPVELINWLPANRSITFVDIGASDGHLCERLIKQYKIHRGVFVEALPNRILELKSKFSAPQYDIVEIAVADKAGITDFQVYEGFDYVSSLLHLNSDFQARSDINLGQKIIMKVKTDTLDHIASSLEIGSIDFLKIDVQGAEHLVLLGATETLRRVSIIYIEVSFQKVYGGSSTLYEIHEILFDNNFRMVDIRQGYRDLRSEVLQADALFVNNGIL